MFFAVGDLVRYGCAKAEIIKVIKGSKSCVVKLEDGSFDDWVLDRIQLDIPATIARERKILAEDITKAIQAGLLPEGWTVEGYRKKQAEGGNVSSGIDPGDAKNPSESHQIAVHTTFDPVSGSGVVFGQVATGKVPVNPSELCDLKDGRESAPISDEPKYPVGSFVKWGRSKYVVKDWNLQGYRIEATEGTFRDSWGNCPEDVLSPWEEPGNPPSRVPVEAVQKPVEIVCVLDEDSYEGIYVDGEFQDHGLFEIGETIGKKTCTIESLRVVLGGEDWPETFDPSWREPKAQTEYRKPTQADLANGPIYCEFRDDDAPWVKRQLIAIVPFLGKPFVSFREGLGFTRWKHCRIKTVSPTDSQ